MNIPASDLPRIVIIGCGFAGLKFVKSIDSRRFQIVLLDRNNYHTFQPLMYQVASAGLEPDSIVYPIRKVFGRKSNFYFRMAEVGGIDASTQEVTTDIGSLSYDHLVLATGATNNFFGMQDMEQHAMPMKTLIESLDLRSRVLQNFEAALNTSDLAKREALMNFVVVGAGATGVELAGALSELRRYVLPQDYPDLDVRRMQINLIEAGSKVLANMSENASKKSEAFLRKMGVQIWLDTQVKAYDGHTVLTSKGEQLAETLIWTAGVQGAPVLGLKIDMARGNRVPVNEFAQVSGLDSVYALGDVAHMPTEENPKGFPMLASVAGQQGEWLAKNFNRTAKGSSPKPFYYKDKGTMATIGRNKAVVDLDAIKFSGLIAWFAWMFVHLMLLVDFRSRLIVFVNWAWSYLKYDKGTRLIIRGKRKETQSKDEE